MYEIEFYCDVSGNEPVVEYIRGLIASTDKDHRIKLKKIREYFNVLANYGTRAGIPYVKHIRGDVWELRPTSDRIFFFFWRDNKFVMLHHYKKQTQQTPEREIQQAERNLADWLNRKGARKL